MTTLFLYVTLSPSYVPRRLFDQNAHTAFMILLLSYIPLPSSSFQISVFTGALIPRHDSAYLTFPSQSCRLQILFFIVAHTAFTIPLTFYVTLSSPSLSRRSLCLSERSYRLHDSPLVVSYISFFRSSLQIPEFIGAHKAFMIPLSSYATPSYSSVLRRILSLSSV